MTSGWKTEDKYNPILDVPEELWQVRDEAIRYALDGGSPPDSLSELESWFSEDFEVYENLHSETAATQFDPALDINSTPPMLDEVYLREYFDLNQDAQITDLMKINFTRKILNDDWNVEGQSIVGIGSRTLVGSDGRSCVIGYTEVFEGQGGVSCYWSGVFADQSVWEAHLQKNGILRFKGPGDIPNAILIEIYNRAS